MSEQDNDSPKSATILDLNPKLEEKKSQQLAEQDVQTAQSIFESAERQARDGNAPSMLLILTSAGLSIQTNVSSSFGLGMLDIAHETFMEMFKREFLEMQGGPPASPLLNG